MDDFIELDFPAYEPRPLDPPPALVRALGVTPDAAARFDINVRGNDHIVDHRQAQMPAHVACGGFPDQQSFRIVTSHATQVAGIG